MYFSHSIVLVILPFFTAATPLAEPPKSRGIAIPITKRASPSVANSSFYASMVKNSVAKVAKGMATYQENTGKPHSLSAGIKTSSKRATGTGSVPLTNVSNIVWYGSVEIGTPPQPFIIDFDTGSSDLFVPSTSCLSCEGHQNFYDPSASSTSRDRGKRFDVFYGNGASATGEQYTDNVVIAGLEANNQVFGVADQYSAGFHDFLFPPDGVMGLAFGSLSQFNEKPVFQTLIDSGVADTPVFGFKFDASGSELFLGGVNPAYKEDDFTWIPLNKEAYWEASFDRITVTMEVIPLTVVGKKEAIFDTGTTMIIGDPDGIELLYWELFAYGVQRPNSEDGPGIYTLPCNFDRSISIYVGGKEIKISPHTFVLTPASEYGMCLAGAASSAELTGDFWILGDVFLRNIYSAWDVGMSQIGFADLKA